MKYRDEDGAMVEPDWYAPIIPVVLVNGTDGVGTGFSTSIPRFNVLEIIENLRLEQSHILSFSFSFFFFFVEFFLIWRL